MSKEGEFVWNLLSAALAMILYVGGTLGPDGVVTGLVFVNAIGIGVASYAFCYGVEWAITALRHS